jgi:hypothetical protein
VYLKLVSRLIAVFALAVLAMTAFTPTAEAHERRQVGAYTFVVGFAEEPAYVEQPNGASLRVTRDGQPVEGLEQSLKVEVTRGGESRTFDLTRVFNQPGSYVARFIPTETGAYTFRFFGTIEGQQINERFESGPGRFNDVEDTAALQFPVKVPSNAELAALQRGPSGGEEAAGGDGATVQDALDRANRAQTIGITVGAIGILAGLAGVVLALRANGRNRSGAADRAGGPEPV